MRMNGFTLIEVLAAGIISTVLGGAMLSMFYMTTSQIAEGAAQSRLSLLNGVAFEQIQKTTRHSIGMMQGIEDSAALKAEKDASIIAPESPKVREIRFYDNVNFWLSGGYRLDNRFLWEGKPISRYALSWKPFLVGADTVFVDPDPAKSYFKILEGRNGLIFKVRMIQPLGEDTLSWMADSQYVVCRN